MPDPAKATPPMVQPTGPARTRSAFPAAMPPPPAATAPPPEPSEGGIGGSSAGQSGDGCSRRRRPEGRRHRHGYGWAEGGYAQASGGPAYPGRAADRLGPVGLSLDALDGLRESIDLDAELTHRFVELPGRMRQTVHVLLDRLDHLGDGSLPLFEQLHAGAFDLLAEVLVVPKCATELLDRLVPHRSIEHSAG